MTATLRARRYTAEATVRGGRSGHGRTSDGIVDLDLALPIEMGGPGGGANPEQLFAVGYGACFQSALVQAGRRLRVDSSESTIVVRVSLGPTTGGAFGLAVELEVAIPGVERDTAEQLMHLADDICPYSNAIRGNVDVSLAVVDAMPQGTT